MPGNPHNASPLENLIVDLLTQHFDGSKIDSILDNDKTLLANQKTILANQDTILANQKTILSNQELIKAAALKIIDSQISANDAADTAAADVLSIKVFLGVPDARIVASQQDVNELGAKLAGETAAVEQFDKAIPEVTQTH